MVNTNRNQIDSTGGGALKPPKPNGDAPIVAYGHEGIRGALARLTRPQVPRGPSLAQQVISSQIDRPRGRYSR